ncbi:hypothetical protein GLAREA_02950 [Glarea lozoyensis ATCC 20868]|uniref:Uncharacterized protein n=1 Tax=Glarea lozoyensis (strain ATCC 20868 / MF5171) TaxID=1116229 RepID=S3D4N1_GLAL2|nr:uncharacterized protein GLAREA_02950 [Glarea lozoyensis ATCC 20868]EPE27036.1 hypothetical protein GLAREA_02950 [Glarea lozoyensis ATCC 20868]
MPPTIFTRIKQSLSPRTSEFKAKDKASLDDFPVPPQTTRRRTNSLDRSRHRVEDVRHVGDRPSTSRATTKRDVRSFSRPRTAHSPSFKPDKMPEMPNPTKMFSPLHLQSQTPSPTHTPSLTPPPPPSTRHRSNPHHHRPPPIPIPSASLLHLPSSLSPRELSRKGSAAKPSAAAELSELAMMARLISGESASSKEDESKGGRGRLSPGVRMPGSPGFREEELREWERRGLDMLE